MPKNKNTKSADDPKSPGENRTANVLLVLFCLAGMGVCLWLFRQDLYRTLSRLNVKPVGAVVLKRRVAQRRFEDRILWDNLQKTVPVYSGDFIRTAERSEAAITLIGDDTVTNLGENTIIQIRGVEGTGESRIEFFGGTMSLGAGSDGTVFVLGKNILTLAAGSVVSAVSDDSGEFVFSVTQGSAVLDGSDGTAKTFLAGEGSAPRALPVVTAAPPGPRLILPADGEAFPDDFREISFRWVMDDDERIALYVLELADNPGMENAAIKRRVSGKRIVLPPPDKGLWYWRVTPVYMESTASAPSLTAAFSIGQTSPAFDTELAIVQSQASGSGQDLAGQSAAEAAAQQSAAAAQQAALDAQAAAAQAALAAQQAAAARQAAAAQQAALDAQQAAAARQAALDAQAAAARQTAAAQQAALAAQQAAAARQAALEAQAAAEAEAAAARQAAAARPPELLPPPNGLRPENGYVLGPAHLWTNRNILFSWNPVPGATAYIFSLFRETDGVRQRVDTVELQTTDYSFNKLSLLEQGVFVWTVQARRRRSNGTLESGNMAESRFTIDLPPLERYELPEAGDLYGN